MHPHCDVRPPSHCFLLVPQPIFLLFFLLFLCLFLVCYSASEWSLFAYTNLIFITIQTLYSSLIQSTISRRLINSQQSIQLWNLSDLTQLVRIGIAESDGREQLRLQASIQVHNNSKLQVRCEDRGEHVDESDGTHDHNDAPDDDGVGGVGLGHVRDAVDRRRLAPLFQVVF